MVDVSGEASIVSVPEGLALPSIDGPPVRVVDPTAGTELTALVFVHAECPTSLMALERLGPATEELARHGCRLVVVAEEPPPVAARLARRYGVTARVLAQDAPFQLSELVDVRAVPTTVLLDPRGTVIDRVVGWDREALERLLPIPVDGTEPRVKPGCESRRFHGRIEAPTGFDELEDMFERGWSDGLPVVPPTWDRVDAMLGGRDPGLSLGLVPPALGEATLERVAACAVLAGCLPAYFPLVATAVESMLDPAFNVHGQAVTTSPPGQILVVNGPIRTELGLNSGMGALGPGTRANMTIGRAVRLVVQLTGGGSPSTLDRATLGHPGKLSFCIAENEEGSPWEPLQVERGFPGSSSTVTMLAGDAPVSIADHRSTSAAELAATIGWAGAGAWSPFMWPLAATSLFVIGPEHAEMFAAAGWTKDDLRQAIYEEVRRPAGELRRGETTPTVEQADDDELIPKWTGPERIVIVVAGGEAGRFSAVIGPSLGMDAEVLTREV